MCRSMLEKDAEFRRQLGLPVFSRKALNKMPNLTPMKQFAISRYLSQAGLASPTSTSKPHDPAAVGQGQGKGRGGKAKNRNRAKGRGRGGLGFGRGTTGGIVRRGFQLDFRAPPSRQQNQNQRYCCSSLCFIYVII